MKSANVVLAEELATTMPTVSKNPAIISIQQTVVRSLVYGELSSWKDVADRYAAAVQEVQPAIPTEVQRSLTNVLLSMVEAVQNRGVPFINNYLVPEEE
ncbi:MAG: hypothetical protein E6R03_13505 [Hyphomicrobiaceae bacterium]|nr:MAG: hypothetical protein E6R03_13505 [Hyphomicrobiaceae bacterium]